MSRADLYCVPRFARGTGLGNRLLPWARCVVFSRLTGATMLRPRWFQPRLGPLLRGGVDLRSYHRQILMLGLFRPVVGELGGWRRQWVERRAPRVPEPETLERGVGDRLPAGSLVTFSGSADYFVRLHGWETVLLERLRDGTQDRWLRLVNRQHHAAIGLNVRRARDFPDPKAADLVLPTGPVRTPLEWFRRTLTAIRERLGYAAPALVVSDGTPEDLRELLSMERTSLLRPGCAISDLLVLATTRVLLASGGSTFSAWASFLGGMPTLSLPGQSLTWFGLGEASRSYVGTFDPDCPSPGALDAVDRALSASRRGGLLA
jgi:hypothetical protein